MELKEILDIIRATTDKDTKLYIVTRITKSGLTKRSRVKDKYLFKVYQMDCDNEMRESLYNATISQVEKTINKNFEMVDYDVLSDETEHLFTYPIQNKVLSFSDVVTNQLLKACDRVTSIANISSITEELWAYCLEFYHPEKDRKIFTFRKILPSKVGVDDKTKNFFKAIFNTKSQQLSLLSNIQKITCIILRNLFGLDLFSHQSCATGTLLLQKKDLSSKIFS